MSDLSLVRRNVRKMIQGGASDEEIQEYMGMEGVTPDALRAAKPKQTGSAWNAPTRFMRRFNDALMFGFGDEVTAGLATLSGGTYSENLKKQRQGLAEAKSNSSLADVIPDTAGLIVSGLATLPVAVTKSGAEIAARGLGKGAEQAARTTAATVAPISKRQVLGEATRAGAVFGTAQGYGTGEGNNTLASTATGSAGGAIIGRALPSAAYGLSDNVINPMANAMRRGRTELARSPQQMRQMFEDADVAPFGPAMLPAGTAASASKALSNSVVGKPLREAAQRTTDDINQRLSSSLIEAGGSTSQLDAGTRAQNFLRHQLTERSIPHNVIDAKVRNSSTRSLRELEDLAGIKADGSITPPKVTPVPARPVRPVDPEYPDPSSIRVNPSQPTVPAPRKPRVNPVDESSIANKIAQKYTSLEDDLIRQINELRDAYTQRNTAWSQSYNALEPKLRRFGITDANNPNLQQQYLTQRDLPVGDPRREEAFIRLMDEYTVLMYENQQLMQLKVQENNLLSKRNALVKQFESERDQAIHAAKDAEYTRAKDEARNLSDKDREAAIRDAAARDSETLEQLYGRLRKEAEDKADRATRDRMLSAQREADRETSMSQARSDAQFNRALESGDFSQTYGLTRETYPTEFDASYGLAHRRFSPGPGKKATVNLLRDGSATKRTLQQILDEARQARIVRSGDIDSDEFKSYLSKRIGKEAVDGIYGSVRGGGVSLPALRNIRTRVRESSDAEAGFRSASDAAVKRLESAITTDYRAKLQSGTDGGAAAAIARVSDQRYAAFTKELKQPLRKIFGEDVTPEMGLDRLVRAAQGKDGGLNQLKAFFRVYEQKGDRRTATAAVLTPLLKDGMDSFVKGYAKLSDEAKAVIYSGQSRNLHDAHKRLIKLHNAMEPYRNQFSGGIDLSQPANWAIAATFLSNIPTGIAAAIGAHQAAKLMASPAFVNWLTKGVSASSKKASNQAVLRKLSRLQAFLTSQMGVSKATGKAIMQAITGEEEAKQ